MEASGFIGAVKIKDGLFLGDEFAAQDLEFVVGNKVTHIVNCAARQVPNHWEPIGVRYLAYTWLDQDAQVRLDPRDEVFRDVFHFIERASSTYESVLVHSVHDISKPVVLLASYLMRKFRWDLFKSLEFIGSRVPNLRLAQGFVQQLNTLESRLMKEGLGPRSSDWRVRAFESEEEAVLQNTFLNARLAPGPVPGPPLAHRTERVQWRDSDSGQASHLTSPHSDASNPIEDGFILLRSALKGASSRRLRVPMWSTSGKRLGKQRTDLLVDNFRFAQTVTSGFDYEKTEEKQTPQARSRAVDLVSPVRSEVPSHP